MHEQELVLLIKRCKKSDQIAQVAIYDLFFKTMHNTAFRIIQQQDLVEDVTQDAFIVAFSKVKNLHSQNTNIETRNTRLSLGYLENNPFKLDLKVYGCVVDSTIDKLPTDLKKNLVDEKGKKQRIYFILYFKKNIKKNKH